VLESIISEHGVPVTTLLTGPVMACFANIFEIDTCLLIVDRLVLMREDALLDIIKHVLSSMRDDLIMTFGNKEQRK
jgi:hypothetical protein